MKIRIKKIANSMAVFIIIIISVPIIGIGSNEIAKSIGLKKFPVPVVGTGSMYPSLFWEISEGGPENSATTTLHEHRTSPNMYRYIPSFEILGKKIGLHELGYGDMVAFKNSVTRDILAEEGKNQEAGFIKRIIGLPGDIIEIRDGFVIRNGEIIEEPYIYKPRSTYGGSFIADCNKITIQNGSILVLGDNRKSSTDSRSDVGLIRAEDITFILPFDEQVIYHDLWRDTSQDSDLAEQPTLNTADFYAKLNEARQTVGSGTLTFNSSLTTSAKFRAQVMLRTNDFSTEATKSGYTMQKAISETGYSNRLTGEFISHGYYTSEELIQNLTYFRENKSQVTNPEYQDIGISVVNGEINNCPTQVIVGHLGGYVPAEYKPYTIESWKQLKDNLEKVIPSWEQAREYKNVNQEKLEELLSILNTRKSLASEVYDAMINKRWLTDEQEQRIDQDEELANRANKLVTEINES